MTTYFANAETVAREWLLVDASNKTLGRLASELAKLLRGKHKPVYAPHADTGDYVVVINAKKIAVTGNKRADKMYYRHTNYPGGLRSINFEQLIEKKPEKAIELAVKGMMPKNVLGRAMQRKLKIYADESHPHTAQQPKVIKL